MSIDLSQFRIDTVNDTFHVNKTERDRREGEARSEEKTMKVSSSRFAVSHTMGGKVYTVQKDEFIDMGRAIWTAGGHPDSFDNDFVSDKERIAATHFLLDCIHSGASTIDKTALQTMVREKTKFFGSKRKALLSSFAQESLPKVMNEEAALKMDEWSRKKVVLGHSALSKMLMTSGIDEKTAKSLAECILNNLDMLASTDQKVMGQVLNTRLTGVMNHCQFFRDERKGKRYIQISQNDVVELCALLRLRYAHEPLDKAITDVGKRRLQTIETKAKGTLLNAIALKWQCYGELVDFASKNGSSLATSLQRALSAKTASQKVLPVVAPSDREAAVSEVSHEPPIPKPSPQPIRPPLTLPPLPHPKLKRTVSRSPSSESVSSVSAHEAPPSERVVHSDKAVASPRVPQTRAPVSLVPNAERVVPKKPPARRELFPRISPAPAFSWEEFNAPPRDIGTALERGSASNVNGGVFLLDSSQRNSDEKNMRYAFHLVMGVVA